MTSFHTRIVRRKAAPLFAGAILVGSVALAGCSSSSTSSSATTTTGLDPDVAQVMKLATQVATAKGYSAKDVTVVATVSSANDSWMHFTITPTSSAPANVMAFSGFAHQAQNWSVVTSGTSNVGCPTTSTSMSTGMNAPLAVPSAVLASFKIACPTG